MPPAMTTERRVEMDLPLLRAEAPIGEVEQGENGTMLVDVVFTSGARIKKYDYWGDCYYWEELSLDDGAVRMERLNSGAPLLNNHLSYGGVLAQLGVVVPGSARIENGQGVATLQISSRDELSGLRQDIKDGIVRKVSVGARIHKFERTDAGPEGLPLYRATDWEPYELSLVPMPADDAAQVTATSERSGDRAGLSGQSTFPCEIIVRAAQKETQPMPPFENTAGTPAPQTTTPTPETARTQEAVAPATPGTPPAQPSAPAAPVVTAPDNASVQREATVAERNRIGRIQSVAQSLNLPKDVTQRAIDQGTSVEDFQTQALDAYAARAAGQPQTTHTPHVQITVDERDTQRAGMVAAMLHRMAPQAYEMKPGDNGATLRHASVLDLARHCLSLRGENVQFGLSKSELLRRAMSSTDFPIVMANTGSKRLLDVYAQFPNTFKTVARKETFPDFKTVDFDRLNEMPVTFPELPEGGEIELINFGEEREQAYLSRFAEAAAFTWRMMVDDDLRAFERRLNMLARAAARKEGNLFWAMITGNVALDVDSTALFHADHNNLGTGTKAINPTNVGNALAKIALQTGTGGEPLNLQGKYLVTPVTQRTTAEQLYASVIPTTARTDVLTPTIGRTEPVAEPRLDVDSAVNWYVFADPNEADTFIYGYLEGEEGLQASEHFDPNTLSVRVNGHMDFVAKALDYRGVFKQPGA